MAQKQKTKKTKMASRVKRQTKPAKSATGSKWFVAGGAVLGLALSSGGAYWWYVNTETQGVITNDSSTVAAKDVEQLMPIRLVEIQGSLKMVSKEELLAVLRSKSRQQESGVEAVVTETNAEQEAINFLTTDLIELEQQIKQLPWMYDVKVRRVWPDKLVLEVQEQDPIAYWNENNIVNRFGETFSPEGMPELALPVLTGPEADLAMMLTTFAQFQQAFEAADMQLTELHLSERRSWLMKLTNGIELRLGRKDLQARVNRFIGLYPMLVSENKAPIEWVDLRYDTGLAVMHMETEQRQASLK